MIRACFAGFSLLVLCGCVGTTETDTPPDSATPGDTAPDCIPDCDDRACGDDGCGGTCGTCRDGHACADHQCSACAACDDGETCIDDRCAPVAVIRAAPDGALSFSCPPSYTEAGRWRTGPNVVDQDVEGIDHERYAVDAGWMWLCSADPDRARAVATTNDCGGAATCAGTVRGSWHVGAGCAAGEHAVDADGLVLTAGWLSLCVSDGAAVRVEPARSDCGEGVPGCGGWREHGTWHTSPATCTDATGVGDSGESLLGGWMALCVDGDGYPPVDPTSLHGKVMTGYQGWFGTPGDGSVQSHWFHWFHGQSPTPEAATFDLWPDLREYDPTELAPTDMVYADGSPVALFSSYDLRTVRRHFEWMGDYGIHGAFLQRFTVNLHGARREFRDTVTDNTRIAAEDTGRTFVIMYDVTGDADFASRIPADWPHLVDDLGVTASPSYQHHDGRPLVAIWGIGFTAVPAQTWLDLIHFFQDNPEPRYRASVMGGVEQTWRHAGPEYAEVFAALDVVSPWTVGRYSTLAGADAWHSNEIVPDRAAAASNGADYLPVVFPGFSWHNLTGQPVNAIPRDGGRFLWRQLHNATDGDMIYVAMFDEVDEGTAIFKAAEDASTLPTTGTWLTLDADGEQIPSDWYLRIAGAAAKTVSGQVPPTSDLPLR